GLAGRVRGARGCARRLCAAARRARAAGELVRGRGGGVVFAPGARGSGAEIAPVRGGLAACSAGPLLAVGAARALFAARGKLPASRAGLRAGSDGDDEL